MTKKHELTLTLSNGTISKSLAIPVTITSDDEIEAKVHGTLSYIKNQPDNQGAHLTKWALIEIDEDGNRECLEDWRK